MIRHRRHCVIALLNTTTHHLVYKKNKHLGIQSHTTHTLSRLTDVSYGEESVARLNKQSVTSDEFAPDDMVT